MGAGQKNRITDMSAKKHTSVRLACFLVLITSWALLSACNFSAAGDITPPPGSDLVQAPLVAEPTVAPAAQTPESGGQADILPTAAGPALSGQVTFSGKVINRAGGEIPAGLEVTLQGYTNMENTLTLTTTAAADGAYRFDPLAAEDGQIFILTTEYQGNIFSSTMITWSARETTDPITADIDIYEHSGSLEEVVIERVHLFVSSTASGQLRFMTYLLISNPGQNVISAAEGQPLLTFQFPQGAVSTQWGDGAQSERFVELPGGFGDTQSIYPGQQSHEVLYTYEMPYDGNLEIAQVFPLPVESGTVVLPAGLRLNGAGLSDAGQRDMGSEAVSLYNFEQLSSGQALRFEISGRAGSGSGLPAWVLALIGGAVFLAALAVGVTLLRRRSQLPDLDEEPQDEPGQPESRDDLLDAIIALDQQYEDGGISTEAYNRRRAALKAMLKAMQNETKP
jgi:hypothetical protein